MHPWNWIQTLKQAVIWVEEVGHLSWRSYCTFSKQSQQKHVIIAIVSLLFFSHAALFDFGEIQGNNIQWMVISWITALQHVNRKPVTVEGFPT